LSVEVHGSCDERFAPLKETFAANFEAGLELGASLALTWRGQSVVDLWAGWANPERTRPWERDTLVEVMSTTKIPLIISGLILVDRKLLDLDQPVARYWPEFAQSGKAEVTVRDAFSHCAGVPGLDPPATAEDLASWSALAERLAREPHWFGGRRQFMYHSVTYGPLLGELIRRVDGRGPKQFFREEVAARCGADFHLGLTDKTDMARVAVVRLESQASPAGPPSELMAKWGRSFEWYRLGDRTTWTYQSRELPSAIGYGNGRSIARICAIMANGGELDGVRYLSRATVEEAAREQVFDTCPYLGAIREGLGFGLHSQHWPVISEHAFHWGGAGGSWGLIEPKAQISLGYAPNNHSPMPLDASQMEFGEHDPRLHRIMAATTTLLPTL
jgi:CubicO group peptidase (beta-lactamase class C family)